MYMKMQLTIGNRNPKNMDYNVENYFNKPCGKVLWTSTYDNKRGSDWVQWCKDNMPQN